MAHFPHKSEGQRSEGRRNALPLLIEGREGSVIMQLFFKVRVDGITKCPTGSNTHAVAQSPLKVRAKELKGCHLTFHQI